MAAPLLLLTPLIASVIKTVMKEKRKQRKMPLLPFFNQSHGSKTPSPNSEQGDICKMSHWK